MDTHNLKITGKVNIPAEVTIGRDYTVMITGSVTSKTIKDNHDGSNTIDYKLEPILYEFINDEGLTVRKETKGLSQKLRSRFYLFDKENNTEGSYGKYMPQIISRLEEVIYELEKERETEI